MKGRVYQPPDLLTLLIVPMIQRSRVLEGNDDESGEPAGQPRQTTKHEEGERRDDKDNEVDDEYDDVEREYAAMRAKLRARNDDEEFDTDDDG